MTDTELDKIIDRAIDKAVQKSVKESDVRMQQYIAKLNKEPKEEMKQYIGAINEESKHNIEAVAEQYLGLSKKVDTVITAVAKVDEKVDNANIRLVGVEIELTEVRRIADATFEAVGNHEERITVLEEKVR